MTDVSIVIPAFGPPHFIDACLNSLASDGWQHEVIVVDNGVGYDLPDWVVAIRNEQNEGFAPACNAGGRAASGSLLCFLNCDAVVTPGWLDPLVAAFDDRQVVMAGPKIIHPDGSVQTTGIRTWHGNGSAGGEERKDDHPTEDVDGVTGACVVLRKAIWHQYPFDEEFRNGYEDVAMCLAIREVGWRIRYVAESTVIHHESVTGPERWQWAGANVELMNKKWGNR